MQEAGRKVSCVEVGNSLFYFRWEPRVCGDMKFFFPFGGRVSLGTSPMQVQIIYVQNRELTHDQPQPEPEQKKKRKSRKKKRVSRKESKKSRKKQVEDEAENEAENKNEAEEETNTQHISQWIPTAYFQRMKFPTRHGAMILIDLILIAWICTY